MFEDITFPNACLKLKDVSETLMNEGQNSKDKVFVTEECKETLSKLSLGCPRSLRFRVRGNCLPSTGSAGKTDSPNQIEAAGLCKEKLKSLCMNRL